MADRPPDDAAPARPPGSLPPPGPEDDLIEGWDDADIDDGSTDGDGDGDAPPEKFVDDEVPEVFGGATPADADEEAAADADRPADASAGEGEDDRDEEDAAEDLPTEDDAPAPEKPAAADPVAFLGEDGTEAATDADTEADAQTPDATAPTAPATPAFEPASEQPAVEPGGEPAAPSEPEAKAGASAAAAPGGRAKEALRRQNDAAGEAATRLRRQMLRSGWLRRAGIASALLLATVAVLVYLTRRFTGDAEWAVHLGWLAFALPPLAWYLHRSTERNTPGVERLRATVERGLRRRDEPEAPDPSAGEAPAREPIGGMLAAGAAALLVLAAAAVPVARPDLEQAAVAFSREAVRLEAQAEALAEAGVIAAGRLAGVREEVRVAASAPTTEPGPRRSGWSCGGSTTTSATAPWPPPRPRPRGCESPRPPPRSPAPSTPACGHTSRPPKGRRSTRWTCPPCPPRPSVPAPAACPPGPPAPCSR